MKISDYDYDLPDHLIAHHPPEVRGASRLLVLDKITGEILDKNYADLPDLFNPGDLLILNDTKVIKSRLHAKTAKGATREIVILERHAQDDYRRHKCMYRGRLRAGTQLFLGPRNEHILTIDEILGDGLAIISSETNLLNLADQFGEVPLPPYMNRDADQSDNERYQTVFADKSGSAAAPTASLNMTEEILARLKSRGIQIKYLTLHVGLGTFLPIRTDAVEDHHMHSEYFEIPADTLVAIKSAKANNNRIVALGTTVARTLEHVANTPDGKNLLTNQETTDLTGEADIFMYPGYEFQLVDALLTNFHAPKSTVLMLAAAFATWPHLKSAYDHAAQSNYQFLSYGDSMLIK